MKRLLSSNIGIGLSSVLIAIPFAAQAQMIDLTPDSSRVLSDPTYLPLQGQVSGTTSYTYGDTREDGDNYLGNKSFAYQSRAQTISQSVAYGLTDDITLRANMSYDPESKQTYNYVSGSSALRDSTGFSDPNFGITYRVLDQKEYPVSLDLIGNYAPDWIDAQSSTSTQTGTIARGGQYASLGTLLAYKTHSLTIGALAGANYTGDRTIETQTAPADYDTKASSFWGYYTGLTSQFRFTDRLSTGLSVRYTDNNDYHALNTSTDIPHTTDTASNTDFGANLNYQIIPNKLVAGLTYDYYLYSNSSNLYPTATSDTHIKDEGQNVFGARLQYVFF